MLEQLKQEVCNANKALVKYNLVIYTWGNVSACSEEGFIVIKPSGVAYDEMKAEDMVVLDFEGNIVEGKFNPSSDAPTHLELYKKFPSIKGICHTHASYSTSFAQAGISLNCLGTTHADYFYGSIPCTRELTLHEVESDYEKNTGKVIIETFETLNPLTIPAVLVNKHGVFSWGKTAWSAVENAVVLEEIAKMNFQTMLLSPGTKKLPDYILEKHYQRKHGINSYYGQRKDLTVV